MIRPAMEADPQNQEMVVFCFLIQNAAAVTEERNVKIGFVDPVFGVHDSGSDPLDHGSEGISLNRVICTVLLPAGSLCGLFLVLRKVGLQIYALFLKILLSTKFQ